VSAILRAARDRTIRAWSRRVIGYRLLAPNEVGRVAEIDRTEAIDTLYVQHGAELESVSGEFSAPPWREGDGEHSIGHQVEECERWLAAGGTAIGAFADGRLVGIGIVVPHARDGVAQLAFLHVGDGFRRRGIGRQLSDELDRIAAAAGDTTMVVSATPSVNTVDFYRRRGYEPTATPLPELLELEPEDVHLEKRIGP
jgi:GNAT superfamily N-acetyltransferase